MKNRIKPYYIILLILNLLSIFFILQIKLSIIGLFNSDLENSIITNINELILNFSIGIILSTLFYIIVVLLPKYQKRNSTLKIIQNRLNTIGNGLNQSIFYFTNNRLSLKLNSLKGLKREDFKGIEHLDNTEMNFKYKTLGNHGSWISFSSGAMTELSHFINERRLMIEKIDEIFSLPTITQVDDALIEILAELRDCHLYEVVEVHQKFGENVKDEKFNDGVYEYYQIFKRLKNYSKITDFRVQE